MSKRRQIKLYRINAKKILFFAVISPQKNMLFSSKVHDAMASHKWHKHPQWPTGGEICDHFV